MNRNSLRTFGIAACAVVALVGCSKDKPQTNSSSITKAATTTAGAITSGSATTSTVASGSTASTTSVATVAASTSSLAPLSVPSVAPSPDGALLKAEEVQQIIGIPVKPVDGCTDIHLCVMDSTVADKFGAARIKSVQVRCDPAADAAAGRAALTKAATPSPLVEISGIGEVAMSFTVKDGANRDHYAMGFYKNKYTCIVSLLADPYTTDTPDMAAEKPLADAIARIAVQRVP